MAYDIYVKRRLDEIEEKLIRLSDPIERLHVWFMFIKDFMPESHALLDNQYVELSQLCKIYVMTPDPVARDEVRYQVTLCTLEIEKINAQMKRVPRLQSKLEKDITGSPGAEYHDI